MDHPVSRIPLPQLFIVGVALPAVLAAINHLLLTSSNLVDVGAIQLCLLVGFYVFQIGFVGWAAAVHIQPWPLRWFIFGWIMVLVDLQLAAMTSTGGRNYQGVVCLTTAILAGQLGVIVVWGILGTGHFVWRVPALLIVLLHCWTLYNFLLQMRQAPAGNYSPGWDGLLTIQAVLLSLLCGALRLRGYSLQKVNTGELSASPRDLSNAPLQFGIRDVLIWTTSLAVILAIAKSGDLLTWSFFKQLNASGILLLFGIGVCTAVVLVVALWSALGKGSPFLRLAVLLSLSLGIGSGIGWYCDLVTRRQAAGAVFWNYAYWHLYVNGYWWIGWMFMSGTLLAAALIIYRALGYRLVRSVRRRKPPQEMPVTQPAN